MTSISFTSGELLDIMSALEIMEDRAYLSGNPHLASYYLNLITQFGVINEKLQELPGENRVANLVLSAN